VIFFERVRKARLSLKPSKCRIGYGKVDFLGHTLRGDHMGPQTESVGHILRTERPKTKKQCRSLLGMVNFYRHYIPNYAEIIAPVSDLTKHRAPNVVECLLGRKEIGPRLGVKSPKKHFGGINRRVQVKLAKY